MQVSVLIGELIKGGSHSCRRPLCAPPPFHPPPLASRPPWRALPIPPVESRRSRPPQQLSLPLRPPTTTMAPFPSPRWSCGARCCRRATPCAWTHNSWPQLGSQRQQSCRCGSVKVCIFIFFVGMCEMSGLDPFSLFSSWWADQWGRSTLRLCVALNVPLLIDLGVLLLIDPGSPCPLHPAH